MNRVSIICVVFLILVVVDGSDAFRKLFDESPQVKPPSPQIPPSSEVPPEKTSTSTSNTTTQLASGKTDPKGSDNSTKAKPEGSDGKGSGGKGSGDNIPESTKVKGNNRSDVKAVPETPKVENKGVPESPKVDENKSNVNKSDGEVQDPKADKKGLDDGKVLEPKEKEKGLETKVAEPVGGGKGLESKIPETKHGNSVEKDLNQEEAGENCSESSTRCTDQKKMIACLQQGPQELFILIQNRGDTTLKVYVSVPDSVKVSTKQLEVPKQKVKKINASVIAGGSHEITLNAGSGVCVLHIGVPTSEGNFFQWIPYANLVTPTYGAYLIFALTLIAGVTWACCKFVKRRHGNGGVPYQELEMGLPESSSAVDADTLDGWDQGWDSDWDEERAVRSPGHRVGNVSANGLTSRSTNKDGWENDWDD